MGDVINLNRFRKKKAREEKERRAETNRRFHGRTAQERTQEEAEKARLEKKLDGAFLVRESVELEDLFSESEGVDYEKLERATRDVLSLEEFSRKLRGDSEAEESEVQADEKDSLESGAPSSEHDD